MLRALQVEPSLPLRRSGIAVACTRGLASTPATGELTRVERWEGQSTEERARRSALAARLTPGSLVVINAASTQFMTNDIPYRFRQNTDFMYLTGFEEPDAVFVMKKASSGDVQTALLVKQKDPWREMWDGKLFGDKAARQFLEGHSDMEAVTATTLRTPEVLREWASGVNEAFVDGKAKEMLAKQNVKIAKVVDSGELMQPMRAVKSLAEQRLAQEVADITAKSFKSVISDSFAGMNEGLIDAHVEWEYRRRGAFGHAFPPVVAGGNRALTLHYITNDLPIEDGEMVLLDSGAEKNWMNSDVSRTWPINGKFTDAQRKVYEAVLKVQKACIDYCIPGQKLSGIHMLSERLTNQALRELGIVNPGCSVPTNQFYPHSIGHWLGMDVHDTPRVSTSSTLRDGMMLTIEPGLYIPAIPEVPEEFHGIGVRIEDNILVKETGPVNLTRAIPKEVDELEALIGSTRRQTVSYN